MARCFVTAKSATTMLTNTLLRNSVEQRAVKSLIEGASKWAINLHWSLSCSWSIACRRCSNYIFILNSPGFNGLGKGNWKTTRETFKLWNLVRLILEIWRHVESVLWMVMAWCFNTRVSAAIMLTNTWIRYLQMSKEVPGYQWPLCLLDDKSNVTRSILRDINILVCSGKVRRGRQPVGFFVSIMITLYDMSTDTVKIGYELLPAWTYT